MDAKYIDRLRTLKETLPSLLNVSTCLSVLKKHEGSVDEAAIELMQHSEAQG